jgi:DNA primase
VSVISEAKLKINQDKLEIPIFDTEGNQLFSKFRKEPWTESDSPKYTYEYGSHIALYGTNFKSQSQRLFLTEGEMDVLSLRTLGYDAYSSTGGAMSWQKDWTLDRIPTVLFDNDETGINGALKTILLLGEATFSWIPPLYGKDVNDVLATQSKEFVQKLLEDPGRQIHIKINDLTSKASIGRKKKEVHQKVKNMESSVGKNFMLGLYKKLIELEKSYSPKKIKNMPVDSTLKDRARAYPIENLIKVGTNGLQKNKALCPFHSEKTPSFHIYPDNTGYCHGGCGKHFDVIDIYMSQNNLQGKEGFKTAIEELSRKT